MENEEKKASAVTGEGTPKSKPRFSYAEWYRQEEEDMKLQQNMPLGILLSLLAGVAGALFWAFITLNTGYTFSYIAWGIGILVGSTMRIFGKGISPLYGIAAAFIAFFSCMLGNFLTGIGYMSEYFEMNFWDMLRDFDYRYAFQLIKDTFRGLDLIFYILAFLTAFGVGFIRNGSAVVR